MTTYGPPTAQEHLRQAMRHSTDPRWVRRQLCNDYAEPGPDIITPGRRIPWGIVITAIIGICFSLAMLGYAYGAERQWVIWDEVADKQFHPHRFVSPTACNTDITLAKDGSGKRLACRRIKEARQ